MVRVAVIDVGTVTARLAIAEVEEGKVASLRRASEIVNLGQDVDKTHLLAPEAMARLLSTIDAYLVEIGNAGVDATCCTMTSAARDAKNASELVGAFQARGLEAQVIPGDIEGSLTFLGVSQDYPDTPLIVADNGGGSTEFALGAQGPRHGFNLAYVRSIDVGCRRLTEKFLSRTDPPEATAIDEAHRFCRESFAPIAVKARETGLSFERLVVTGGTVTTLVALAKELVPYDSAQVHLSELTREMVRHQEERLASCTVEERTRLAGIQVKRAPVILGGAIAVGEIMDTLGFDRLTVSESDLLVGLALSAAAAAEGGATPTGWLPKLSS